MSFNNSDVEPEFFIGEIVTWSNKVNSIYVKIVSVYKIITESNVVFFRYGGLKELDNNKWDHIENNIFNIVFNEDELTKFKSFELLYDNIEESLSIKFEEYDPEIFMLDTILQPYNENTSMFAINFKNTIEPKIKIKSIYESKYSTLNDIVTILSGHRYITNFSLRHHTTEFLNMEIKGNITNWKEYRDVKTLNSVYVNHTHKLTSVECPKTFLTHDIDEIDNIISIDKQSEWTVVFRKLITLLESKNCNHIIDKIKSFLIPSIKYSVGDAVYYNQFAKEQPYISNQFIAERYRYSMAYNMIVHQIFMIQDHNKLWKPRYLLMTLDTIYKIGYCDEEWISNCNNKYRSITRNKINNLSKYINSDIKLHNQIWEDSDYASLFLKQSNKSNFELVDYIKKRKTMRVNACLIKKTFKQYKGDIYGKELKCFKRIEAVF